MKGVESYIQGCLFKMADEKYRDFNAALIPNVDKSTVIGVRTPDLRKFSKEFAKKPEAAEFLKTLPHKYFEENSLHAFLIETIKDFDCCVAAVEAFLPFVDNWATCDTFSPPVFKKNADRLLPYIEKWLKSDRVYTVRYAVGMLMRYFLDERFEPRFLSLVSKVPTEEYYLHMMTAWYFATALAKQYEATLPYIENKVLDGKTHNKAIQKAAESFRVSDEHKAYLKTLKVKPCKGRA